MIFKLSKGGFTDPRSVSNNLITVQNKIEKNSVIFNFILQHRLLNYRSESDCEDYGEAVIYKGTIKNNESYRFR